ncbi:long-chain-fatty-acid--CoA ligase [Peribacillus frigoritolerans]|uniref:class I adenylate-forming enzyme family protein n=1 Tax=Peribacillus frigoritolerans TaxID=450367 RepID=UPI0021D3B6FD|nr:long-chain-fatty-acid--CoA ligase [Peribacillus frigoritolerans]MCU6598983.1 long-chain-fatty-acid--CoA ligase [Peribacillus frigoritolerans]
MDIGSTLAKHARCTPEKIAVYFKDKSYTYDRFNREVNRLTHALIREGINKGDKIALMMKNSDMYMIAFLAIMKVGGVAVPVNYRLTPREVAYILDDSDSKIVFFDDEYSEIIHQAGQVNSKIATFVSVGNRTEPGQKRLEEIITNIESDPSVYINESDDAEILYTSGTTGNPKGVLIDHHRLIHVAYGAGNNLRLNPQDNLIHLAPLIHAAQLNGFMVPGTFFGCTQVVQESFEPVEVLKAIEHYKISLFFGVPTMYNFLLQVKDKEKYDLSSVNRCGYGASPMPVSLLEKAMEMFNTDQFYNMCGLTEGGPGGIYLTPKDHKTKMGASGKSRFLMEARVVDQQGKDVAPGEEVGELILRGETVMKEYYKKPEATAETLRNGWLYTGDLCIIDEEGFITLVDRRKDMIISGGVNIYSTEVEQVLYMHPDILEAAVIGMPDEVWGEKVTAVFVPKNGKKISEEDIIAFCRTELAGYKIPRMVVESDQLPRNASGKVLKYQLRDEIKAVTSNR